MKQKVFRLPLWVLLCAVVLLVFNVKQIQAQQSAREVYNEQLRVYLDQQEPTQTNVTVDGGGWFSFAYFNYEDGPSTNRELRQYQLRGWLSLNIQNTHEFYLRGLLNWDDWRSGTNPSLGGDDFEEELERAWYRLNVMKLFGADQNSPMGLYFKVGRDFQTIGNSLTLSIPLDMIHLQASLENFELTTFVGKTIYKSQNIDNSLLLDGRQDRVMFGAELAYGGFSNHRPFVYFLGNWDHTDPAVVDLTQSYKYDSRYVGVGSRGSFYEDDLRYEVELVGEWGETYSNNAISGRDRIEAYAFDTILEYYFDGPKGPVAMFEYIRASGDPDRGGAVSTKGGNTIATVDRGFNAFGFRDTGIAFGPRLSNLNVFIGGFSCFPLEDKELFKEMEIGAKVFGYSKARSSGAISDISAASEASWLGCEWDIFCNWRITSDVAWTIRYGMFHPANAFDGTDKSARDAIYTGLVFSF